LYLLHLIGDGLELVGILWLRGRRAKRVDLLGQVGQSGRKFCLCHCKSPADVVLNIKGSKEAS